MGNGGQETDFCRVAFRLFSDFLKSNREGGGEREREKERRKKRLKAFF